MMAASPSAGPSVSPSPLRAPAGRGVAPLAAGLLLALLATGCASPGMKLTRVPVPPESRQEIEGVSVRLRPLLSHLGAPPAADAEALRELLDAPQAPYLIGPQDILQVTVWDHPELVIPGFQVRSDAANGSVVDEDGCIFFPHVGRYKVAGLTVNQAREGLTTALGRVFRNPQLDVKVTVFRSQRVYVGGEVRQPSIHPVSDTPLTLLEAINRSGGLLPSADDSRLLLSRKGRTWRLDFQQLVAKGNRIGPILLRDGDALHVPSALDEPVYLLGEVARPGMVPLVHGQLTLAQAVSSVGGVAPLTSNPRCVYVLRGGPEPKSLDVYHLDARNPMSLALADRFWLQPRDIVYVDAGPLVRWNRVVGLLLPTLTAFTSTASDVKYLVK